jgi:hypothetical protein
MDCSIMTYLSKRNDCDDDDDVDVGVIPSIITCQPS